MKLFLTAVVGSILILLVGKYVLHLDPRAIGQSIGVFLIPFMLIAMRKMKKG